MGDCGSYAGDECAGDTAEYKGEFISKMKSKLI